MTDCIFCKIVKGELPAYKIYEDDAYMAFLDIFPFTRGHTLVIPKEHYTWVWDVEDFAGYMQAVQKIAKHFQKVTQEEMVISMIFGEGVPHAHVRLAPLVDPRDKDRIFSAAETWRMGKLDDAQANELVNKLKLA